MSRLFPTLCAVLALLSPSQALSKVELTAEESTWLKRNPAIRVAFDGSFPPYSFVNEQGVLEGYSVDVLNLVAQQLDTKILQHGETQWERLFTQAKQGEVDVVATMVDRPARRPWFHFTAPYIHKSLVLITESDNSDIRETKDLRHRKVALVKGYQHADTLLEEHPSIEALWVNDMLDALNTVATGNAQATIGFIGAAHFYRTKFLISNLKFRAIYDKNSAPERMAIRKSALPLATAMNKALANIPEAQLQALREKWLPSEVLNDIKPIPLTQQERDWIKRHPSVKLAIDPEFAPFEYIENNQHKGITSDYVRLLERRLGLKFTVDTQLNWNQAIDKAQRGEIDIFSAVAKNQARESYLLFSDAYLNFHRVIVTEKNHPFISGIQDLSGKRIGVQANSSHYGYVIEETELSPIVYNSLQESLLALSGGEIDAFIGNVAASTYWIRKLNLTNLRVAAPISRETQNLHFAVRKDLPTLLSIINKGLASISEPEKIKIAEKWMNIEYRFDINYDLIIEVTITLLFVIVAFLTWNLLLKRAISQHKKQLLHYTHHDQITNLPNRFLMMDRLHQLIAIHTHDKKRIALLSINIDGFKDINDSHGHKTGDRLLAQCALRFETVLKQGEVLGRLGGDQFIVILPYLSETTYAAFQASALINSLTQPIQIKEHHIAVNARVGIAIFPDDGLSEDTLLKAADLATHHAREKGRGKLSFYTHKLNDDFSRKIQIEKHISVALQQNELYLAYQPKFCLKHKRIHSFEALLRWESPILGSVPPAEFIPILEQNGLIHDFGMFALNEAVKTLKEWQTLYDPTLSMAVNLSPK